MERALFLKTLGPMAESLSLSEIAAFAELAQERRFRKGEPLLQRGEPVGAYQVVVEGAVHAAGGEYLGGRDLTVRDPLGFLSMLSRQPDGVDAVATEDTVTLQFDDDVFYDILEDNFVTTHALIRQLAKRTLDVRRQIPPDSYLAPLEGALRPRGRPLDLVERILLIRRPGSPFERSSLDALTQVAQNTPEVSFEPGATLWKSGDRSSHALILVAGSVACTTQWGVSRFRAGPGYPLGNLERFSGDPRWYSAVTETAVTALRTDTEPFLDILEDNFDMAADLLQAMALRLIHIQEETAGLREAGVVAG